MIEPVVAKLIWVAAVLAAYGLFRWRWLVATQGIVIRTVREAEQWSQSPGTNAAAKNVVMRLTAAAYRPFAVWCIAVFVSVGVVNGAVRNLRKRAAANTGAVEEEPLVTLRLLVAVLTTSPITLVLVAAAFCLGLLFRGSVKTLLELMPQTTLFAGRLHQPSN